MPLRNDQSARDRDLVKIGKLAAFRLDPDHWVYRWDTVRIESLGRDRARDQAVHFRNTN